MSFNLLRTELTSLFLFPSFSRIVKMAASRSWRTLLWTSGQRSPSMLKGATMERVRGTKFPEELSWTIKATAVAKKASQREAEAEWRTAGSSQGAELWQTCVSLEQGPDEIHLIIYERFCFLCEFTDLELKDLKRKFCLYDCDACSRSRSWKAAAAAIETGVIAVVRGLRCWYLWSTDLWVQWVLSRFTFLQRNKLQVHTHTHTHTQDVI